MSHWSEWNLPNSSRPARPSPFNIEATVAEEEVEVSPGRERFRMAIVGQLCGRLERGEVPFAVAVPQGEDD
jgi:hypothetical protein